jgi:hypothetical protein
MGLAEFPQLFQYRELKSPRQHTNPAKKHTLKKHDNGVAEN